jgi:hypothetical protein
MHGMMRASLPCASISVLPVADAIDTPRMGFLIVNRLYMKIVRVKPGIPPASRTFPILFVLSCHVSDEPEPVEMHETLFHSVRPSAYEPVRDSHGCSKSLKPPLPSGEMINPVSACAWVLRKSP